MAKTLKDEIALEIRQAFHSTDATIKYVGYCDPGQYTNTGNPVWRIQRIATTAGGDQVTYPRTALGALILDNAVWNNRETYTYPS